MLRSLWAGVSGMQAHQVALDVESNNIANVNTVGFKYSRANFADMLSQINRIATTPQGGMGGMNDFSVGLGTNINSTTRVFTTGSLQGTDNKTDLAIEGDGFFVVSINRGRALGYTRDGSLNFDAQGNLVTNAGYIVQGWTRDVTSSENSFFGDNLYDAVDTTVPVKNIMIDPKMVLPARATTSVALAGTSLTSSDKTSKISPVYAIDSTSVTASDGVVARYDSLGNKMQMAEDMGILFNSDGNALKLTEGQGIWMSYNEAQATKPIAVALNGSITLNGTTITFANDSASSNITSLLAAQSAINAKKGDTGVDAYISNGQLRLVNRNELDGGPEKKNVIITASSGAFANFTAADNSVTAFRYAYTTASKADSTSRLFRTTEDLRALIQQDANNIKYGGGYVDSTGTNASVKVTINRSGMFEISNQDDGDSVTVNLSIMATSYYDNKVTTNVLFRNAMRGINTGILAEGGNSSTTAGLGVPKHVAAIDVVDSIGIKHSLKIEFRKVGSAEWSFSLSLPEPAEFLNGSADRPNYYEGGRIAFGEDGSLTSMNPPTFQFFPKTGAKSPQRVNLDFGEPGTFSGITSTNEESYTGSITQNGYQAGSLYDYRFDSNGTLIGQFTNGKSLALAQVALATFTNNAGLQAMGSNLFAQSANSGDPAIGAANLGGKGGIASSTLEMSNVDLSRSLTQLIVVQRGFQANSKSVTTSDQILNTLLQLKQ